MSRYLIQPSQGIAPLFNSLSVLIKTSTKRVAAGCHVNGWSLPIEGSFSIQTKTHNNSMKRWIQQIQHSLQLASYWSTFLFWWTNKIAHWFFSENSKHNLKSRLHCFSFDYRQMRSLQNSSKDILHLHYNSSNKLYLESTFQATCWNYFVIMLASNLSRPLSAGSTHA